MSLSVVLVNYQNVEDTIRCLDALLLLPQVGSIIVVDNASADSSLISIEGYLQQKNKGYNKYSLNSIIGEFAVLSPYALICLPHNLGYSGGNNAGIRLALQDPACEAVWLLNNDTIPDPNALDALCRCLNDNPDVGIAGSSLVYAHAPERLQCAAGFALNPLLGTTKALHGNELLADALRSSPQDIAAKLGYVSGASMLVRREVFERIGLLAEEYFLYYEDAEFSLRARRAGYKLAWARDSIVLHKEGGSSGAHSGGRGRELRRPALIDYLSLRNRVYLMRSYYPLALPVTLASYAGVIAKRVRRGQADRIPLVLKAMWHGLTGKMGKPYFLMPGERESERPLKVLFITLRADFGGGPEHLYQLLRHLPEDCAACVACPEDYPYYERYAGLVGKDRIFSLPHRWFSLTKLFGLRAFCRRNAVTIIHSHGKGAGLYARLLSQLTGLACVHTFHGLHMGEYGPVKKFLYRLYERLMSRFTSAGIAVSQGEKQAILAESLMPDAKLRCIPNGVALPDAWEREATGPPWPVVAVSRFDYAKNSEFLVPILEALRRKGRLEDFRFILIGDGPGRQALASLLDAGGLAAAVRFEGARACPHIFFKGALCCLSTSRWEGMPLALLEAMAHGLPAVATDVTGNRDAVLDGENGFLYPEGAADTAADIVCRLADEPELRKALAVQARGFVAHRHDVHGMADATYAVLREAL